MNWLHICENFDDISEVGKMQLFKAIKDTLFSWCSDQLTEQQIDFLNNQQEKVTITIDGLGEVLFVHGSPRSDEETIRKDTHEDELEPMISFVREPMIICGHTHLV